MACASSCTTQDHRSYGECLRSKNLAVYGLESTGSGITVKASQRFDNETDRARRLMSQGMLPDNCGNAALDKAERISNETGVPYRADA